MSSQLSSRVTLSPGKATGCRLDGGEVRVRVSVEARLSFLHVVQTGFAAQTMVPVALISETKRPGREAYHSPPSSVDVRNTLIYTSTSQYVCLM
jgi:hypothetical protein